MRRRHPLENSGSYGSARMTILTAPTRSLSGELEFAVAGWYSLTDYQRMTAAGYTRSRSDLVLKDYEGTLFTCQFANSFKMQYAGTGQRIVIIGNKYLTKSGELVGFDAELTRRQIAAGGYEYESFARDVEAERKQAVGRWIQREISRMNQGLRDARGRRFGFRDNRGTTLNLQVGSGAGDAHETNIGSSFSSSATSINMHSTAASSSSYHGGFYFSGVTIPNAATIDSAVWQPYIVGTFADDPNFDIGFEKVANAANFTATPDVFDRAGNRTTALVDWITTGTGAGFVSSPDLASPLQEIVDQGSWSSGNAVCLVTYPKITGGFQPFTARSYDFNSSLAAKLDIDYTAGGGGAGIAINRNKTFDHLLRR